MSDAQSVQDEEPRYPSTLAPSPYYSGLSDRITSNLLPTFSKIFELPTTSTVLEIASGNGIHSLVYSNAYPKLEFQPTECDVFNLRRIDATCQQTHLGKIRSAIGLDVTKEGDWARLATSCESLQEEGSPFDLVLGHNFLHMIPFPEGPAAIFRNLAKHHLVSPKLGLIAFYGPFKHDDGFFSEGDRTFNQEISSRPSNYPLGLRSIDGLARIAQEHGFELVERVSVPKGNFVLIFRPQGAEYPDIVWK